MTGAPGGDADGPSLMDIVILASLVALAGLAIFSATFVMRSAKADRDWRAEFTRAARIADPEADAVTIENLRNFAFDADGIAQSDWRTARIAPARIAEIWYFVEPFAATDLFGHSFLTFVFAPDDDESAPHAISVSVEARLEKNEDYSAIAGLFRAYELAYVWSEEKDILSRIAVKLDHEVEAYRLALAPQTREAIFRHFVKRTEAIAERPRFYNTIFSNCTNELAKSVNDAIPGALPWRPAWILTGRSAAYLHRRNVIEPRAHRFESIRARAGVGEAVRANADRTPDELAALWRQEWGEQMKPLLAPER